MTVSSTKSGTDRTSSVTIDAYSLVDESEVAMRGVDAVRHGSASDEDSPVAYMKADTVDIGYMGAAITLSGPSEAKGGLKVGTRDVEGGEVLYSNASGNARDEREPGPTNVYIHTTLCELPYKPGMSVDDAYVWLLSNVKEFRDAEKGW